VLAHPGSGPTTSAAFGRTVSRAPASLERLITRMVDTRRLSAWNRHEERIVHGGPKGQAGDRTDTRDGHEPQAGGITSGGLAQALVELLPLAGSLWLGPAAVRRQGASPPARSPAVLEVSGRKASPLIFS
jgi:hypothetical protein